MIQRVRVTGELVCELLRGGNEIRARVVAGLPADAALVAAEFDPWRRELVLGFEVPGDAGVAVDFAPQLETLP